MIGTCAVCGTSFFFTKPVTHRATCAAEKCRRAHRSAVDCARAARRYARLQAARKTAAIVVAVDMAPEGS